METQLIDQIYTPRKFAQTFGKGAGRAGRDMSEKTALRIFKSPGFPKVMNGSSYLAYESQIKKWIESGGKPEPTAQMKGEADGR